MVVSSDHAVRAAARRQGAASLTVPEFLGRLEAGRVATLKGGEEEDERAPKTGKGTARRLPKAQRRMVRRLRGL